MGLLDFLKRSPRKRQCARCGEQAAHGYSPAPESDPKEIVLLCLPCLAEQLHRDYAEFRGRAVIAPALGLPCYAFRTFESLRDASPDFKRQNVPLFQQVKTCADCQGTAQCLWIESRGLTLESFGDVIEEGPQPTILTWGNPNPNIAVLQM